MPLSAQDVHELRLTFIGLQPRSPPIEDSMMRSIEINPEKSFPNRKGQFLFWRNSALCTYFLPWFRKYVQTSTTFWVISARCHLHSTQNSSCFLNFDGMSDQNARSRGGARAEYHTATKFDEILLFL